MHGNAAGVEKPLLQNTVYIFAYVQPQFAHEKNCMCKKIHTKRDTLCSSPVPQDTWVKSEYHTEIKAHAAWHRNATEGNRI